MTMSVAPMYPWTPRWNPIQKTFFFYNHLTQEVRTQCPPRLVKPLVFIPIVSAPVTSGCSPIVISVTPVKKRMRDDSSSQKNESTSYGTSFSSNNKNCVCREDSDDDHKCRKMFKHDNQKEKTQKPTSIGQEKFREVEHGSPFEVVVRTHVNV